MAIKATNYRNKCKTSKSVHHRIWDGQKDAYFVGFCGWSTEAKRLQLLLGQRDGGNIDILSMLRNLWPDSIKRGNDIETITAFQSNNNNSNSNINEKNNKIGINYNNKR